MLGFRYGLKKLLVQFPVSGIKPIIAGHLEMFFRYVLNQKRYGIQCGKGPLNIRIILVPVIMEGHMGAIIGINPGGGDDGPGEITADVFDDGMGITKIGFGIDVETIFVFTVNGGLVFLKEEPMRFSISPRRAAWKAFLK